MRKEQAIKKHEEWNRKHINEASAVHEAGHMFVNKRLFGDIDWVYTIGPMGQPYVDAKNPSFFDIDSDEMLIKVLQNRLAGVVSEAYYNGLADNAMDILENEINKFKNEEGTDEYSILKLLEGYHRANGKNLNIRSEVAKVIAMFRAEKSEYMAEVHSAKRHFKDFDICNVCFDRI